VLVKPLGGYMTRVIAGERTYLSIVLGPVERGLYRIAGTSEREDQHWTSYAFSLLMFNLLGVFVLYALQRFQAVLPYNPAGMAAVPADLSFKHGHSFCDQHQLAELWRREHHCRT